MKPLSKFALAALATVMFAAYAPAHASMQMAVQYGCINCHGAHLRGEAPSFERLAEKMAEYKGDEAALAQKVIKYRMGAPLEHIGPHERISAEAATQLLRWLAEGGK